ncbi:MAG: NUDIX domain-containing protein [Spirochaetota bacterium]
MKKKFSPWKTLLQEEVFSTPWMSIYHNQFEIPDGKKGNYFYMHTNGSALTIPVCKGGNVLLVAQYRYLTNNISIEIPCGGVKQDQKADEAARAELIEETGYECKRLKRVGGFVPYNGLSDEFCSVFIARKLFYVGTNPDETEQIEVIEKSPQEIDRMIEKGKIVDGMSIAGWMIGRKYV